MVGPIGCGCVHKKGLLQNFIVGRDIALAGHDEGTIHRKDFAAKYAQNLESKRETVVHERSSFGYLLELPEYSTYQGEKIDR